MKPIPDPPVGFLGWSAAECEPAAPPEKPSVCQAPPKHPGPSDAESGAAVAPHSLLLPHPVSPIGSKTKSKSFSDSIFFNIFHIYIYKQRAIQCPGLQSVKG